MPVPHALMVHAAPPLDIAPGHRYLLLDTDEGPVFERVEADALLQIAVMADVGFVYDRFSREDLRSLRDRCRELPPDLLDGDPDMLLAPEGPREIVLYTQVQPGQASPRYRLSDAASAPSPGGAAACYLGAYRHGVLTDSLAQFDEMVLHRIREAKEHRSATALAAGFRDFHLRLLREAGLRGFLTRLVQQGESILLIRTRDLSDYSLWLSGRELRRWLRERGPALDAESVILDVEFPSVIGGMGMEAHPAPVKLIAHISPAESIVFCHPTPRVAPPRRPRTPSAAACARWGENITPLRRKH